MSYYMAGDYYAAGGLFSRFSFRKLGRFLGHAVAPIANIVGSFIPGAGLVGNLAENLAGHSNTMATALDVARTAPSGTPGMTARASAMGRGRVPRRGRRMLLRRRRRA